MTCELCDGPGGVVWWSDALTRVVHVIDEDHPGTCRVILDRHVREATDLEPTERRRVMDVVFAVEQAIRDVLQPLKVNLASLGNLTPHLHWHVIPRFADDPHFPRPVWAEPLRARADGRWTPEVLTRLAETVRTRCDDCSAPRTEWSG